MKTNVQTHSLKLPSGEVVRYAYSEYKGIGNVRLIIPQGNDKPYRPDMSACKKVPIEPTDYVVDIGAYVGTYALMAAAAGAKEVVAYEPSPRQFAILERNTCEWENIWVKASAIVASKRKSISFYPGRHGIADSAIPSRQRKQPVTVPATRYSDAVAFATVVKVDIEGGEYGIPVEDWFFPPRLRALIVDFHKKKDWKHHIEQIIEEGKRKRFKMILEPNYDAPVTFPLIWVKR